MTVDEADQTHDWIIGVEVPWCRACGLGKISAHIWGDDNWTKEPVPCSGGPSAVRTCLRCGCDYSASKFTMNNNYCDTCCWDAAADESYSDMMAQEQEK